VIVDETVVLSETLGGGNTGSYSTTLSCTSSDGTLDSTLTYTPGDLDGSLEIHTDDSDATITCTFTNNRQTAALHLAKQWVSAVVNDTANLSLNGINDNLDQLSTADTSNETDNNVANITVYTGETVQISETLGAGNSGSYTTGLTCVDNNGALTYTAGALSGSLTITSADANGSITCTFTNTISVSPVYSVTISKDLVPNTDAGRFDLKVQVDSNPAVTVSTAAGDGDSGSLGGISSGSTIEVTETAVSPADAANYDTTLVCQPDSGVPSVITGPFAMPADNVTCTFTNTHKAAQIVLQKAWVDGFNGDQADISINGINDDTNTSTADGSAGTQTDSANTATITAYAGETIVLFETLSGTNTNNYARDLTCQSNNGSLTYTTGGAVGTLAIVPADANLLGAVTCTFTNTSSEEPNLFDPPSAVKTLNADGLPEIEFTMVWINDSNTAAINVQITDLIPAGTTYVGGSLDCSYDPVGGLSQTTTCTYLTGPARIFWEGTIGPDPGATNATDADDELVITFRVLVPDTVNAVENQGTSVTDRNGDTAFDDEDPQASVATSNRVRWRRGGDPARALPDTGFAPGIVTRLHPQPVSKAYTSSDLDLEIPRLGQKLSIVGVPLINGEWDVTWLGSYAGYLEGTAFPTAQGNTGITAHVWDANNAPGPFANLKTLQYGDVIKIHAWGNVYTYSVRYNFLATPGNMASLQHEDYDWVTLLTCEKYSSVYDNYRYRRVVRAVLVDVSTE
jgi:LPXTG-site transpeptidase (sortase) family protein